ncbi:MAG TPA: YggT family protein [Candidatus Nanopelagicales bacterium]|nr:YggT family protein [Candidatus Nanopelagicales bacterium]
MTVGGVVIAVLQLYVLVLIAYLVITWVMIFAREWQPKGVVLLLVEGIFAITEPPLRLLRRFIPPLRIGGVQLDIAFIVLFLIVQVLILAAAALRF